MDTNTVNFNELIKEIQDKEKQRINNLRLKGVFLLKKPKFYSINGSLREHVANTGTQAVLLKNNKLTELDFNEKEVSIPCSLVQLEDLKKAKRISSSIIKKQKPASLPLDTILKLLEQLENI